jgi:UDPglucose 6-dehydrogenase
VNAHQRQLTLDKLCAALDGVHDRTVAVLGLSFKPNTSDVRESPGLEICRSLAGRGAKVRACDPVATDDAARSLADVLDQVTFVVDAYEAAYGADALVIMTEWNEFRSLNLDHVRHVMRGSVILDARNVLDPAAATGRGFRYLCTGRQALAPCEAFA